MGGGKTEPESKEAKTEREAKKSKTSSESSVSPVGVTEVKDGKVEAGYWTCPLRCFNNPSTATYCGICGYSVSQLMTAFKKSTTSTSSAEVLKTKTSDNKEMKKKRTPKTWDRSRAITRLLKVAEEAACISNSLTTPEPIGDSEKSWSCRLCTFDNPSTAKRCEMCASLPPPTEMVTSKSQKNIGKKDTQALADLNTLKRAYRELVQAERRVKTLVSPEPSTRVIRVSEETDNVTITIPKGQRFRFVCIALWIVAALLLFSFLFLFSCCPIVSAVFSAVAFITFILVVSVSVEFSGIYFFPDPGRSG